MAPHNPDLAEPTARRRILTVLFIGVFMAALDAAIIAPAIPALRSAFDVDQRQVGMVTIVFSLCTLSSTALMASLSDRYGRRPIYLLNVAAFGLGSLLIAVAPNFGVVLLGRAIQGFSAGGITPTASAVVGDAFPAEERGKALGLIGATFGMAFLLGPLVASLILIALSWQWIFLLNLPVAAAILWRAARDLPPPRPLPAAPFDWRGILVVATMLTSLTLGINRVLDDLVGLTVWPALLLLAAVCVPALIAVERRAAQPIVPLTVFGNRQLVVTYILTLGAGFGMGSVIFIASVAVEGLGVAPEQAGFLLIPLVLSSSAGSVLFGRLLNRIGSRAVLLWGFGALALGSGLVGLGGGLVGFIAATLLIGLGVGVVVGGSLRAIVLAEVQPHERGAAQGLVNIGIGVGNLLVVAALGLVADMAGGGIGGLGRAYMVAAAIMVVMALVSLGLKGHQQEQATLSTASAG